MPITYQIDHTHKLVDARALGLLTDGDIFQYQRQVWGRSDVVGYNEIVDMSDVGSLETESVNRIRQLAELSAGMDPVGIPSKFAIVVCKPVYGDLGRIYGAYRKSNAKSTKQVGVFTTREDALRWLDTVEDGALLPIKAHPGDA